MLSRLFRGKLLAGLKGLHAEGELSCTGALEALADPRHFADLLAPLYETEWVVYAKPPFGGPRQVLDYLSRYTHRIAISNHRLLRLGAKRWSSPGATEPTATGRSRCGFTPTSFSAASCSTSCRTDS